MKTLKQSILEKLKVNVENTTKRNTTKHTLFPETKDELKQMIKKEISKHGNECSLNHIDVSKITDMSKLFSFSNFDGDISGWNTSNVTNMNRMFLASEFNGDISNWNVSSVTDTTHMFKNTPLEINPPKWYKR